MTVAVSAIIYPPIAILVAFHSMDEDRRKELIGKIKYAKWLASFLFGSALCITAFWLELQSDEPFSKFQASQMIGIAFFFLLWVFGHITYLFGLLVNAQYEVISEHVKITDRTVSSLEYMTKVLEKE